MKRIFMFTLLAFLSACGDTATETTSDPPQAEPMVASPAEAVVRATTLLTDGVVTDFTMLSDSAGPTTISIAPNGDIWYTLSTANAIGRMDRDGGNMIEYPIPTLDSSPRIIALGSDGNMWFSEHNSGKMGRITPGGEITEYPLSSPDSQPRAIALGSDGNIWVGMFAASKIGRISPDGEVTEFDIPTPDSGPRALAAGPDGNIWVSEFKAAKIARITPDGEITEFSLPRDDIGPGDITAGADGNMWFLELNGAMDNTPVVGNKVARITMDGEVTEFDIPSDGGTPINIAVGPDRNVWYTKNNTLGRVTPAGEITEFPIFDGPARAVGLSAGSDRQNPDFLTDRLWFTDPANNRIGYLQFTDPGDPVATLPSDAMAADGRYISWREHLIDDQALSGIELRGSDGLEMADLDLDGYMDIVTVHESDDVYDGAPEGHIRIHYGSADPDVWHSVTLAEGPEAGAAEDVAIGDINGDGFPDIVAACELSHIIYFQNPGEGNQNTHWPRVIPAITQNRGSFIRVFLADFNNDGRLDISAPNKGAQDPARARQEPKEISVFEVIGDPLDGNWREDVLTRVPWPINAEAVDLDGDGDMDIVGGSVAQTRMVWFENVSAGGELDFIEHSITTRAGTGIDPDNMLTSAGFNMEYEDFNGDGRLDILTLDTPPLLGRNLVWLEQPADPAQPWTMHLAGTSAPDSIVGIRLADIDGDGDRDIMSGGYSLGSRLEDNVADITDALGRMAWWENTGEPTFVRRDFSRRERGMFDMFIARDMDADGDLDFVGTRGNSGPFDGVFWLEQVRTDAPMARFRQAREEESPEYPLAP